MSLLPSLSTSSSNVATFNKAQNGSAAAHAQQTLANRLNERLGLPAATPGGQASDYTPEKVAARIIGFAEQTLQREKAAGADPERLEYILGEIRKGVDKGIGEARDILDSLGVLQGKVASDIDDTYSRIQTGLDTLQKGYTEVPDSTTSLIQSVFSQRSAALAERFELSVTTNDGDVLRISIAQASAAWSSSSLTTAANGNATATQARSEQGYLNVSGWQVSVEGELDDEEKAALEKLLGQVGELSDRFFSGDYNGAFDRALELQLDGEQLLSMSLQLTQTSVRQATNTYSSVASGGTQAISVSNPALAEYARGLLEALASADSLLRDGKSSLERLLTGALSLDPRATPQGLEKAGQLNERLLQGLQGDD
ncbi:hypothetical protein DNJ95_11555 [Stutzerimonas kirkiae]|uniref:DUF5610 domain-containing protein n=1 Tax=Stutzerimonas kirkiae TaxID=2211392 RepID=A0A4Q9R4F3_9GAMM|nr:DUF5610 domain-containing protein [Stutzerimonas kirkiae]TBU93552.1 hypothetical protein DNJ96_14035 [Stutzerimonas kirkiae]TBV01758.1 hypothetical protein DNJ95_11555 [Stutzerimonas kirkiae]